MHERCNDPRSRHRGDAHEGPSQGPPHLVGDPLTETACRFGPEVFGERTEWFMSNRNATGIAVAIKQAESDRFGLEPVGVDLDAGTHG